MEWESRQKVPDAVCPASLPALMAGSDLVAGCGGRLRKFTAGSAGDFRNHDDDSFVTAVDQPACHTACQSTSRAARLSRATSSAAASASRAGTLEYTPAVAGE
jgi:hypothetical protein